MYKMASMCQNCTLSSDIVHFSIHIIDMICKKGEKKELKL